MSLRSVVSTEPGYATLIAPSCKALTYMAAQGVRASEEPARSSVARPDQAPPESCNRAVVARSTGSTRAAVAVRPGRALSVEGRWTPGSSVIHIRAAAAAPDRLQAAVLAPRPPAPSSRRAGYRCGTCAKYP